MNATLMDFIASMLGAYLAWAFILKRILAEISLTALDGLRRRYADFACEAGDSLSEESRVQIDEFLRMNIAFVRQHDLVSMIVLYIVFRDKIRKEKGFSQLLADVKASNSEAVAEQLQAVMTHAQILVARQMLWSFPPTALMYLIAYLTMRGKDGLKAFFERHRFLMAKVVDAMENVAVYGASHIRRAAV